MITKLGFDRTNLHHTLKKVQYFMIGREVNNGLIFKLFMYVVFISTAYIFLHPILRMIVKMVMNESDLMDPSVTWIPSTVYLGHLASAWEALNYGKSVFISIVVSLLAAIFHCVSCGLAGYAFAKLDFPFKKIAYALLLISFIIPPQVVVLPTIIAYRALNLENSLISLVVPALFGFGVKGALFVIIFRQFFMTQPKELEEAAKIDGAHAFRFYWKVIFPLAMPAIVVVFLFSFVWTWNDTYFTRMFLGASQDVPLAMQMSRLNAVLNEVTAGAEIPQLLAEPIKMAASFLTILPPLILFFFTQRYFVESVERTGIVE